jgi:predicted membrane-bound dolichyl-phosphate-mannose-protein mannosyltransferase
MFINAKTSQGEPASATPTQWALWYAFCALLLWLYVSPLLFYDGSLQFNTDEANYVWKADHISRDISVVASERAWRRHPPLVPVIVGLLAKFMPMEVAVLVATKTLALAGLVTVYILGAQLMGPVAGLIASALLAADPTYRMLSNKLLLDIPLMILFVVCASLLVRGGRYRVWAVAAGILALFVKVYGILVLVFAGACIAWEFLIGRGWRPAVVLGIVLLSSAVTLLPLGYYLGHIPCCDWLPWLAWLAQQVQLRIWSILDNSIGWIAPGLQKRYLAFLLLLAIPFVVKMLSYSPARTNVILLAWIATILAPFLVNYSGDERVILLFAPALYLIVGASVAQGLRLVGNPTLARSLFAVSLLGCVAVLLMARKNPEVLYYTECRFRAYHPTGEWIKQNVSRSAGVVFTRSSHQVRLYAKSDFQKDGGIFYGHDEWTGVPRTVAEFQRVLDKTEKTAYLIVDIEEKSEPYWLYPPSRDAAEAIRSLGFDVAHVVWVPVNARCDIPEWPYYSELPGFLDALKLPLYRNAGATRERIDAVVFKRNGRTPLTTSKETVHRHLSG